MPPLASGNPCMDILFSYFSTMQVFLSKMYNPGLTEAQGVKSVCNLRCVVRLKNSLRIIFLLSLFSVRAVVAFVPHRSIENLPSANGLSYISFNLKTGTVDRFQPHVPDVWDVGRVTPNLIKKIDCKLNIQGKEIDLSRLPISHAGYLNGTGIIRIEYDTKRLNLVSYIWAPMILEQKAVMMVIHIPDARPFHLNPEDVQPYVETKNSDMVFVRNQEFEKHGFWVGGIVLFSQGYKSETVAKIKKSLKAARPNLLLDAEQRWWMHWHRLSSVPSEIIREKYEVLRQSAAFIKMAQCREPGPSKGQIVNSLSRNSSKIATPREMSYAIIALSRMGYFTTAKSALNFMLRAGGGQFEKFRYEQNEWGMGQPYLISLSYYAGMGYERARFIGGNPILHYDGQSLFLWALMEYFKHSTDIDYIARNWQMIKQLVIDPLVHSIDETGLIRKDSGWWDMAPPGEHFTFTSLCAFQGLNSAAMLAHTLGHNELAAIYTKKAADLRADILTKLTIGKSLTMARSLETKKYPAFLDASTVEALNWGIVDPFWRTARSISKGLDVFLRVGGEERGFALGYGADKKRMQESPFITLRAVVALRNLGEKKRAAKLLDWVIAQASLNSEMIPEFMSSTSADYRGAYPMTGLGAAAYIMAVLKK